MSWIMLILAGLCETGVPFCIGKMREASGAGLCLWAIALIIAMGLSLFLLSKAVHTIPIGTAYPVWTDIGAVGAVVIGILFFQDPVSLGRMFFITTLIISIIGLKLV